MRAISLTAVVCAVFACACGRGESAGKTGSTSTAKTNDDPMTGWSYDPVRDSGRVIQSGSSRFAVIDNPKCPGTRMANTRFTRVEDLLVRITEDVTVLECSEGMPSSVKVLVWRDTGNRPFLDSITTGAMSADIVTGAGPDGTIAMLQATHQGGMVPGTIEFWNLATGQRVFTGETPLFRFVANGVTRFLTAGGSTSGDTVGFVEYGTGARPAQRLALTGSMPDSANNPGMGFEVDSTFLDGPRAKGSIVVGTADRRSADSVAISGVTFHVRLGTIGGSGSVSYIVKVVDDRIVLVPPR